VFFSLVHYWADFNAILLKNAIVGIRSTRQTEGGSDNHPVSIWFSRQAGYAGCPLIKTI
jgi:hypothetical protein